MSSSPSNLADRNRKLENEVARLQQEVVRLRDLLGLRAASERPAATTVGAPVPVPPVKPLRILLADDHPVQAKMTQALLDNLGYSADTVRNGQEVLYALEHKPYDVLLMDVQMPVMNGFETTAEIRTRYPAHRRPRIVALTGRNLESDRSECLKAGMDDFLGKPVSLKALASKLAGRSGPLVNAQVFADLAAATGADTIKDVVEMFLRDMPLAIAEMRDAVKSKNPKAVRDVAHPQVSVCHALGVIGMSQLARRLETFADEGQLDPAPDILHELEDLLAPVEIELRKLASGGAQAPVAVPEPAPTPTLELAPVPAPISPPVSAPASAPSPSAPVAAVEPAARPVSKEAPYVLVVEDNPVNLKIALSLLNALGCRAEAAGSGSAAIRALERQTYALVLMDIVMPTMDGLTATRQIVSRWRPDQRPPIIGVTGLGSEADRRAGLKAGMDDYVIKPLTRQALAAKLAKFGIIPADGLAAAAPVDESTPTIIPAASSVLLDEEVLKQWALSGHRKAVDMIDQFLGSLPRLMEDLRRSSDTKNASGLERVATSLKSLAVGVGAVEMATLAAELESLARSRDITLAGDVVKTLDSMGTLVDVRLRQLRSHYSG